MILCRTGCTVSLSINHQNVSMFVTAKSMAAWEGTGAEDRTQSMGTIEQIGATVCTQHCAVSADRSFLQGICLWTLYKESNMSRNEMLGKQSLKYFSSFNHPLLLLSMEWTDDWFIRWWGFFSLNVMIRI